MAAEYLDALNRETPGATVYVPHEPTPPQRAFLGLTCREALYGGAAGGGKSDALLMDALQHVHVPKYSAILFRRTYTDLALPGAIMDRSHDWLSATDAKWNDRDKTWVFPSGASLTFGYLDGPRDHYRYQGSEFQYVGFDELTQFLEKQYLYLFSRLRKSVDIDVPLKMRGATNPGDIGHEWVKRRFLEEPEGRQFVPAKLEDNPHLDLHEYEQALAQLDPVTRQQLRDGLWVRDTSALVYYAFDDARNRTRELPDIEGEWSYILGCDFGVTDPTAYVVLAFSRYHDTAYVVRSEQWRDLPPSQAAEVAKEWDKTYHFERIVGDTGGLGKAYEAEWRQRYYLPMHAAQKTDKLGYIKLLNGDLSNGKLRILPGNDELLRDLRSLAWADDKHLKEHPALPNHLPDALLYAWRDARHWDWEEAPSDHLVVELAAQMEAERTRKARIIERNRRMANEDDNDWILGET
jgi:hypothetical protein